MNTLAGASSTPPLAAVPERPTSRRHHLIWNSMPRMQKQLTRRRHRSPVADDFVANYQMWLHMHGCTHQERQSMREIVIARHLSLMVEDLDKMV